MAIWDPPAEIGILLYPDVASATVDGLTDLFNVATTLARERCGPTAPILRVTHWRAEGEDEVVGCVFDTHPHLPHAPTAVIVPGSWQGQPKAGVRARLTGWLGERHAAGATLCSVCGGAFILAETGLLAGRSVTTHWTFIGELADRFPDLHVDEARLTIEDGNFITAGGVLAWTDLGLKLVDRHLGPTIMLETARFMLADPPGREQRYYSNFAPKLNHGDAAILKVQHWLQVEAAKQPSVSRMAEIGGFEERTFFGASGRRPASTQTNIVSVSAWAKPGRCSSSHAAPSTKSHWLSDTRTRVHFERRFRKSLACRRVTIAENSRSPWRRAASARRPTRSLLDRRTFEFGACLREPWLKRSPRRALCAGPDGPATLIRPR